jgi:site-specific DNA-methyltransferase (adenine-specific)
VTNRLYYGDNLDVLRNEIASESVDLIYLDPPFNSNANYNILFKSKTGDGADAQIEAFEDTWHWNDHAEDAFDQVIRSGNTDAAELLRAMRTFLGENDMMAYLSMMAIRLIELHRVLKPAGSLYLHCDPTASHYLKLLLDGVFGPVNFQNEIIWKRTTSHASSVRWAPVHDTIFFYSKTSAFTWNRTLETYDESYIARHYRSEDERGRFQIDNLTGSGVRHGDSGAPWRGVDPTARGRHWAIPGTILRRFGHEQAVEGMSVQQKLEFLDEQGFIYWPPQGDMPRLKRYLDDDGGVPIRSVINDIGPISAQASERLGYPTQKPLALLERIISASSNEGDVVLDPFCGCGTAVHAAQKLGRQWIGIDVTHLAISLIEKRLRDAFPGIQFEVHGTPKDLASAEDLASRDKYQFQWWAVSMVDALPFGGKKKGADGGIDGIIYFKPDGKRTEKALVSVKGGGNVSVNMIRDLHSAMEREKAPMGVFITKVNPTTVMEKEAAAVGRFEDEWGRTYPKLQIITLAELFQGKKPDIPFVDPASVKRAKREDGAAGKQGSLL